jgi:YtxH-like protein
MTLRDLSQQLGSRLPEPDDLLHWIGLQQQRAANDAAFTVIGAFALGTVVGGALALLFAPKPGHELRHDLGERLDGATQRIKEQLTPARSEEAEHHA